MDTLLEQLKNAGFASAAPYYDSGDRSVGIWPTYGITLNGITGEECDLLLVESYRDGRCCLTLLDGETEIDCPFPPDSLMVAKWVRFQLQNNLNRSKR